MTNKLNDPKAAPKTYWPILNRFLYNKKIPAILLLLVNGKQGWTQTRSTYASAEDTSTVVKLLKKYRNTGFLLQSILFFSSANRKD